MLWTRNYVGYRTHEDIDSVLVFGTSPSIFRQRVLTQVNVCSPVSECRNVKSLWHLPVEKAAAAAGHRGSPQPGQLAMKYYQFKLCGLDDEWSVFVLVAFDSATFPHQEHAKGLRTSYMKTLFFPALARLPYTSVTSQYGGVAAATSAYLQATAKVDVHASDWSLVCDYIDTLASKWEDAVGATAVYYYVAAHGSRFDVRGASSFVAQHCRLDAESVSKQVLVQLHVAVTVSPGTGRASFVYFEDDSLFIVREEGGENDKKEEKEEEEEEGEGSSGRVTEFRPYGLLNAGHVKGWGVRLPGSELAATVTDVRAYDPNVHIVEPVRRVLVPYMLFGGYRDVAAEEEDVAAPESCGTRDGLTESRLNAAEILTRWKLFVRSVADEVKLRVECVHTFANLNDPLLRKTLEWIWTQPVEQDDAEAYALALAGCGSGIEMFVKTWARELVNGLQVHGQLVTCVEGWESWVNSTAKTWTNAISDEIDGHQWEDDPAYAAVAAARERDAPEDDEALELRRQRRRLPEGFHLPFASCVRRIYDAETLLLQYAFSSTTARGGFVDTVASRRAGMYTDDEEPETAYSMSTHHDDRLLMSREVLVRRFKAFNNASGIPPMTDSEIKEAKITTTLPWMEELVVYLWRTLPADASPSSCTEWRNAPSRRTQAERLLYVHAHRIARLTGKQEPTTFYTVYSSREVPEEVRDVVDVGHVVRTLTDKKDALFRLILSGTVARPANHSFLERLGETIRRHVEVVPLFDDINLRRWATVVDRVQDRVTTWNFAVEEVRRELYFGRRATVLQEGDPGVVVGWKNELIVRLGTGEKVPYELAFVLALFVAQLGWNPREGFNVSALVYAAMYRYVTRHSLSVPKLHRLGLLVDGECYMGSSIRPDLIYWLTPEGQEERPADVHMEEDGEEGSGTRGPLEVAITRSTSPAAAADAGAQMCGVPASAAMPPPPTLPMRSEEPTNQKKRKMST